VARGSRDALPLALSLADEPGGLGLLGEVVREAGDLVLPNVPFDGVSVGGQFVEQVSRRMPGRLPALSTAEHGEPLKDVLRGQDGSGAISDR
jgi:hypothetical protein